MTREEALEYFEYHMRFYCVTGVCREAEEMAVEEFKKEPCEDAISREAALDYCIRYGKSDTWDYLHNLPSVQPIRQWVPINGVADLPRDRKLWVTVKYVGTYRVAELYWDMTEWSDDMIARYAIAYMDYYEPEPYTGADMREETNHE